MLRGHDWFHFSGDYRIGTRYLDEPILDLIKQQAMQVPFLRDLLRRDWIDIKNNIKIHDLGPVLTFVGKLGDPEWGGLPLDEFSRRQAAYRDAEIAAMRDVPELHPQGPGNLRLPALRQRRRRQPVRAGRTRRDRAAGRAHADPLHPDHHARGRGHADPPRAVRPQAAVFPPGLPRRAAAGLPAGKRPRIRRAGRAGRFHALGVPAPVPFAHPALRGDRRARTATP